MQQEFGDHIMYSLIYLFLAMPYEDTGCKGVTEVIPCQSFCGNLGIAFLLENLMMWTSLDLLT